MDIALFLTNMFKVLGLFLVLGAMLVGMGKVLTMLSRNPRNDRYIIYSFCGVLALLVIAMLAYFCTIYDMRYSHG